MRDPYTVLGVARTATRREIADAYRAQLRAHHPDLRAGAADRGHDERLRQVLAAYEMLRDPRRRAAYDRDHPVCPVVRDHPVHPVGHVPREPPLLWVGPVRWHRG